ncbi:hypothetical protein NL676_038589 [Syzygium grande]|nr:hypothetical protein NL676_038589 [Syzygium grande]
MIAFKQITDCACAAIIAGVSNSFIEALVEGPTSNFSAIGVPEMDHYLRFENCMIDDEKPNEGLLHVAINKIKVNTCRLAFRQAGKIWRLSEDRG